MKQLFARFAVPLAIGAALAACSGMNGQTLTPSAAQPGAGGAAAPPSVSAQAVPERSGMIEVTAADRAAAQKIAPGQAHIFAPAFPHRSNVRPNAPVGYPLDMTCQTTACTTMPGTTAFNIYVTTDGKTCAKGETCWGKPEEFLKGLAGSALSNLITQYTKSPGKKYTYGGSITVHLPFNTQYSNTFYNYQLFSVLVAAATHFQKLGLNYEYHLFLPPGIDTCFDQTGECYSPDNTSAFAFCAYHSAVMFNGSPVIYSVEPYQGATVKIGKAKYYACQAATYPHGSLDSATASTLSHESFESWSDPLPNSAWFNAAYGEEIGDVCAYRYLTTQKYGKNTFSVQEEYSNTYHGCADKP